MQFLSWNDSRAEDIIMNTNYTTCTFYCSSRPSTLQNNFGQNACCTGVYVPQVEATASLIIMMHHTQLITGEDHSTALAANSFSIVQAEGNNLVGYDSQVQPLPCMRSCIRL